VLFVLGHGAAHPRKFGVASHVGVALDHPTVGIDEYWPLGCAGSASRFPPVGGLVRRGSRTTLRLAHNGDVVGHEVYTRPEEPPIYASPGHRVGVEDASELALRASPWHRLPEPLHAAVMAARRSRDAAQRG
jgi:deoxyribonuclease V